MRQHSGKKRLGAVLLSLALCLSLLPTAALAAEEGVTYIEYSWNEETQALSSETKSTSEYTVIGQGTTTWNSSTTDGWYVAQGNVTIDNRVTVKGAVRLILADDCTLTVNGGINVAESNSLTIYGQSVGENVGKLVAKANTTGCAGIGGGSQGNGGTVTIHGGNVTATGGSNAAGIGGGTSGDGGTVNIYGGTVEATSSSNGGNGAGIGGGYKGNGGEITISGGKVTASSGGNGAGIGGGYEDNGGEITISGGTVEATGSSNGAGIGGGYEGNGGEITISGGKVTASSGSNGAGIGGGSNGAGGKVTISGGTVEATGSSNGAGIGGGYKGNGGEITICGGTIEASGSDGAGIGGGRNGAAGTFSTGNNGHAVIFASGGGNGSDISDQSGKYDGSWSGVIFEGDEGGKLYGDTVTPTEDFTIGKNQTLTIDNGKTLVIQEGVTLTNEGTITNNGSILLEGGKIEGSGSVTGSQPCYPTKVSVSFSKDGQSVTSVLYGSTVTITAKVTSGSGAVNSGTVTFYRGEVNDSNKLNEQPVAVTSGSATHTISALNWTPSDYTITAAYSGVAGDDGGYGFAAGTGTGTLTVNKAAQATPPGAPSGASAVTASSITLEAVTGSGQGGVEYGYTTGGSSSESIDNWQDGTTFNNLTAATAYTFYARYAGNDYYEPSDPSAGTPIYTAHAAPEEGKGYTIDYAAETVTAQEDYEVKLPDGDTWTTSGTALSITPGGTFQVRHAADTGGAPASTAVAISIPARLAAPDVTGGVERIQGATTAMEYRTGDGSWTQFTQATVGHLDPGTYTVRLAATASAFASDPVTVEVTQYTPPANPNYRIDVTTTEGGTVAKDPAAAKAGETVTLTPAPDAGYEVGTVTVTDRFGDTVEVTEQANGTYTFTMPSGQVRVEVTFVEAAPEPLPFTDVNEGDWFHDAVRYAYDNGLMDGVGEGQFAPNATTTRAQLVTILYRLAGEPAVAGDVGFTDVVAGQWYTDAVAWAAQKGIVNGISETEFAPSGDLTREQLATILFRYAESAGYDVSAQADLSGFPDAGDIQSYATEALSWAVAEGLLQGFEDDSLQPGGTATRAQIATILMRFCEGVAK